MSLASPEQWGVVRANIPSSDRTGLADDGSQLQAATYKLHFFIGIGVKFARDRSIVNDGPRYWSWHRLGSINNEPISSMRAEPGALHLAGQ